MNAECGTKRVDVLMGSNAERANVLEIRRRLAQAPMPVQVASAGSLLQAALRTAQVVLLDFQLAYHHLEAVELHAL